MAEAVTITKEEMDAFMGAVGFTEALPDHPCGEVCYEAPYGTQGCRLRVYSTIAKEDVSREVGADAIRVVCVDPEGSVFLKPFKRVHRVRLWRKNLLNRIDEGHAKASSLLWREPMPCGRCGGVLKMKTGKHGSFMGCTSYPRCRNTKRIEEVDA